jgi:hypothetical protein
MTRLARAQGKSGKPIRLEKEQIVSPEIEPEGGFERVKFAAETDQGRDDGEGLLNAAWQTGQRSKGKGQTAWETDALFAFFLLTLCPVDRAVFNNSDP